MSNMAGGVKRPIEVAIQHYLRESCSRAMSQRPLLERLLQIDHVKYNCCGYSLRWKLDRYEVAELPWGVHRKSCSVEMDDVETIANKVDSLLQEFARSFPVYSCNSCNLDELQGVEACFRPTYAGRSTSRDGWKPVRIQGVARKSLQRVKELPATDMILVSDNLYELLFGDAAGASIEDVPVFRDVGIDDNTAYGLESKSIWLDSLSQLANADFKAGQLSLVFYGNFQFNPSRVIKWSDK